MTPEIFNEALQAAHAVLKRHTYVRGIFPKAAMREAEHAFASVVRTKVVGEPFAEDDPTLPAIEARAIVGLVVRWRDLRDNTMAVLGLSEAKQAKSSEPSFTFDAPSTLLELAELEQIFVQSAGAEDGPLVQQAYRMFVRGLHNAAAEAGATAAVEATRDTMRATVGARGLTMVRNTTVRAYRDDIARELASGAYDGMAPRDVARKLRERFGMHEYDWERLARSELALAQVSGKEAQYREMGIERYDYVTANDSRVSDICRANAAGGPYLVGQGPLPMRDSHPNCRCTVRAHVD